MDPLLPEALDGVTAEGENEQVVKFGKPEHALEENETELLYPDGPTVIVNCAACPASTVCEAGDTPNVKSFTLVVFGATAIVNACVFVSDEPLTLATIVIIEVPTCVKSDAVTATLVFTGTLDVGCMFADGLNEHVAPVGRPMQARFTVLVNAPTAVTRTVNCEEVVP